MVKWIRNTKAFTLIEIMIVVVIMAILVAIVIPNFINYVEKKRDKPAIEEKYEQPTEKKGTHQGIY